MKHFFSFFLLTLALALFTACGDDKPAGGDDDDHGHAHNDDGSHADDHEEGDDHGDEDGHDDHGERTELGSSNAGAFKVTLALFGAVEAGKEAVLDIDVEGGTVAGLRTWVGVESGSGSMKAKLDGEDGAFHGHLEIPAKLADGSAIWVQVEDADGKRAATSFKIP
jgi:hypothetical protein